MKKYNTIEELYGALDDAISEYTNETISSTTFKNKITELNDNEFGVIIDKDLVRDNREDFNEEGYVSYNSYEEESSYDEDSDN